MLLEAVAGAVLRGDHGDLVAGSLVPRRDGRRPPFVRRRRREDRAAVLVPAPPMTLPNGLGGFTDHGRSYAIVLEGTADTPMPWVNVIANPRFGTIVTSSGAAHTWSGNSRENRLTPFANDPISDPTGEALLIRDEETGEAWSPTPAPLARPADGRCVIRHSAGLTRFSRSAHGILHGLDIFVDADDPVKFSLSRSPTARRAVRTLSPRLRRVGARTAARR